MKSIAVLISIFVVSSCFRFPFGKSEDLQANAYVLKDSQKYAAYSSITHCPKTCIEAWTCGTIVHLPKLVNVTYLENSVTKAVGFIGY